MELLYPTMSKTPLFQDFESAGVGQEFGEHEKMAPAASRHGSGDSHQKASITQTTSINGHWKFVKESFKQISVLRRFGVECQIEKTCIKVHYDASPGLRVIPSQTEQELEKSLPAENTATKSAPTKKHQNFVGKAFKICKDLALNPHVWLTTFIGILALKNYTSGEMRTTDTVVAVAVALYWLTTNAAKKPTVTVLYFTFALKLWKGVRADDPTDQSGKPLKDISNDYASKLAVEVAIVVVALTICGAGVARRMCNLWRPLQAPAPEARAQPALAVPAPAGAIPAAAAPVIPAIPVALPVIPVVEGDGDLDIVCERAPTPRKSASPLSWL